MAVAGSHFAGAGLGGSGVPPPASVSIEFLMNLPYSMAPSGVRCSPSSVLNHEPWPCANASQSATFISGQRVAPSFTAALLPG